MADAVMAMEGMFFVVGSALRFFRL